MGLVTRRTWFPEGLWRLDFNVSFFVQENSFFFSHICMIDAAHFRHQGANIHLAEVTFKEFVMRSIGYRYLQQKKKANHCLKSSHPVWDVTAGHAIGAWAISPVPVTTSGATGIWIPLLSLPQPASPISLLKGSPVNPGWVPLGEQKVLIFLGGIPELGTGRCGQIFLSSPVVRLGQLNRSGLHWLRSTPKYVRQVSLENL